jgi:hypothetical protein
MTISIGFNFTGFCTKYPCRPSEKEDSMKDFHPCHSGLTGIFPEKDSRQAGVTEKDTLQTGTRSLTEISFSAMMYYEHRNRASFFFSTGDRANIARAVCRGKQGHAFMEGPRILSDNLQCGEKRPGIDLSRILHFPER